MRPDEPDPAAIQSLAGRVFGSGVGVERVREGVSTFVYRVRAADGIYYVRVLPEAGASFAPEVWVHETLRARGVRVAEVVYFDHRDTVLDRSVMATREIPGRHVGHLSPDARLREILGEAGRQLALINSIPVEGFGWIRRDRPHVTRLEAEHPTQRAFALDHLEADLARLQIHSFADEDLRAIRAIIDEHADWLDADRAWLAHGDFDVTPIFQQDGRFTGIIDFGEIRGADRWYDFGHFRMHDEETQPARLLDWLVAGYRSVIRLSDEFERRICFASLLIGIRTAGNHLVKGRTGWPYRYAASAVRRDISVLLG